jgi:hypothetical protein
MSTPEPYDGPVEGILRTNDYEVLRDLMAVVEATQEKNVRLTKSGIPPKPLWSSINSRLLWADPKSILQDWDEVDQVRFIYYVAENLHLLQADVDRNVSVGPGADRFFLASPSRRAAMVMRAYTNVEKWDERCDARNQHGHRLHFGQTFRRDFAMEIPDVRRVVIDAMGSIDPEEWYTADELAKLVGNEENTILISVDDDPPELEEGETVDSEIKRFVVYWLYQAARFGWVDLARTPEESINDVGERLFQLSDLGQRLLGDGELLRDDEYDFEKQKPFSVKSKGVVTFDRTEGDAGDEYLLRRIADPEQYPDWDDDEVEYVVTEDSLEKAAEEGIAYDGLKRRILDRVLGKIPAGFQKMVDAVFGDDSDAALVRGLTVLELEGLSDLSKKDRKKIEDLGVIVTDDELVVPWDRFDELRRLLGFEPSEGFRYPSEEPLARVRKDLVHLEWPVLPLASRDLLEALGVGGEPLQAPLNEALIKTLDEGWTARSVAESLRVLSHDKLPKWLEAELD